MTIILIIVFFTLYHLYEKERARNPRLGAAVVVIGVYALVCIGLAYVGT